MPMARITMLLAYASDRPDGDTLDRIEITAALTPQGQIDRQSYLSDPKPWPVLHHREGRSAHVGELVETETGWALRGLGEEDDPLWTLEAAIIRPGDYATLQRPDGRETVFRIVNVEAA